MRRPALFRSVSAAITVCLAGLAIGAVNAPSASAATSWYPHRGGTETPSLVQAVAGTETASAASLTINLNSNDGDLLVGLIAWHYNGVGVSRVTDTAGNRWNGVGQNLTGCTSSRTEFVYATDAKPVTSVTITFTGATLAAVYIFDFANMDTAAPYDTGQGTCATSTSPSTTFAINPDNANEVVVGYISSPSTIAFSAGPSFSSGVTNNSPRVESNASGTIDDLIAGYDLPGSTAGQNYSGTLTAPAEWTANSLAFRSAGNFDNSPPTPTSPYESYAGDYLYLNSWATWESGNASAGQTFAAGTYTFQYWTNNPRSQSDVTATLTFGYSSSSVCSAITPIASWSATILAGVSGATVSTTTSLPSSVPAGSYLCWKITVTAVGKKLLGLLYDSPNYPTNLTTP